MLLIQSELRSVASNFSASECFADADVRLRQSLHSSEVGSHAKILTEWEQHYDQISHGRFEGSVTEAWVAGIQIFEERMSQAVSQTGVGHSDSISLGVFSSLPEEARWQGSLLDLGHVTSLGKNGTLELSTPRHCTMLGVSVPVKLFFSDKDGVSDENLATFLHKLGTSHVCSPRLAAALRYRLGQALLTMTYQPAQLALIEARNQLQSEIVGLVDEYVGEALQIGVPASPSKALRVVARAREYIEQHRDLPITVPDLCKHTFTSRRTLQYCFEQVVGTSPAAYLKVLRLNGFRRDLVLHAATIKIGDLAARWGFWHLSQFSLDYKRLFGELPSETAKRLMCH